MFKSQKETGSFVLYFPSLKREAEKMVFKKHKSNADTVWDGARG